MTFKDCIAKELFIVVNYKRSMQSFPVFIFYSVKREREREERRRVVKCLQNVCSGSPTRSPTPRFTIIQPAGYWFYDHY